MAVAFAVTHVLNQVRRSRSRHKQFPVAYRALENSESGTRFHP